MILIKIELMSNNLAIKQVKEEINQKLNNCNEIELLFDG